MRSERLRNECYGLDQETGQVMWNECTKRRWIEKVKKLVEQRDLAFQESGSLAKNRSEWEVIVCWGLLSAVDVF